MNNTDILKDLINKGYIQKVIEDRIVIIHPEKFEDDFSYHFYELTDNRNLFLREMHKSYFKFFNKVINDFIKP